MRRIDTFLAAFCFGCVLAPSVDTALVRGLMAAAAFPVAHLLLRLVGADATSRRELTAIAGIATTAGLLLARPLPPPPTIGLTGALVEIEGRIGRNYGHGHFDPQRGRTQLHQVQVRAPLRAPLPDLIVDAPRSSLLRLGDGLRVRGRGYLIARNDRLILRCITLEPATTTFFDPRDAVARLRLALGHRLETTLRGTPRDLGRALLLGRPLEDRALRDAARVAGVAHLLVVSGLHLGLLTWVLAPRLRRRWAFVVLVAYAALAGGAAPVLRALAAVAFTWGAPVFGRRPHYGRGLLLAAAVTLLIDPAAARSPGVLLSFSAVGGILAFGHLPFRSDGADADDLDDALAALEDGEGLRAFRHRLATGLRIGFGAWLGTAPATLGIFGTLAPWAPIASLVLAPLVALLIALLGATLALPLIAPLTTAPAELLRRGLMQSALLPGANLAGPPRSAALIATLIVALLGVAALMNRRPRSSRRERRLIFALAIVLTLTLGSASR